MKNSLNNIMIRYLSLLMDIALLTGCFVGINEAMKALGIEYTLHFSVLAITVVSVVFFFALFGLYDSKEDTRANTLISVCLTVIITLVVIFFLSLFFDMSRRFYISELCYSAMLMIVVSIWRILVSFLAARFRDKNKILIIESDKVPSRLARKLKYSCTNLNEAWYYIVNESDPDDMEYILNDLIPKYDIVYISENLTDQFADKIFYRCINSGITINLLANPSNVALFKSKMFQFSDTPVMEIPNMRLSRVQRVLKRALDILIAVIALIVFSPFFICIPIAIKLDSKGPVFYLQERYTIGKKRFMVYKFRTMRTDAEKLGAQLATEDDPRITRVGKVLRKLRLDELPQFLNILGGSMSVVGPRPERPIFADQFCEKMKYYELRYFMKAGLTGYAQIYGRYNTRTSDKILMDIIYAIEYSFWLDIKLIILTVKTMFTSESTQGVDEERDALLNSPELEAVRRQNLPFKTDKENKKNENIGNNARV